MKGSALIAAFILIIVGSLFAAGFIWYISNESWASKRVNDSVKALYIAEAGLERKLYEIETANLDNIAITLFPEEDDLDSYYSVTVEQDGAVYKVTSTGIYHLGSRKVRQNVLIFNLWDLAVFSGGTTTGQMQGSAHIRGTVYVLGEESFIDNNGNSLYDPLIDTLIDENNNGMRDHLASTDYAINGSGSFYVGNDYNQFGGSNAIPEIFSDRITPVSSLDAGANVKYGKTVLEGSSQIGNVNVPMDLVNVPDGFIPQDPTGVVFVEEGGLLYDRGMFNEKIRFPSLYDVVDGATRMSSLQSNGLVLTTGVDIPEDITPTTLIPTIVDPENPENWFGMDGNGNMSIGGIVYIIGQDGAPGNLSFDMHGNDRTIWYTGEASLVLTGNLTINTNLYTQQTGPTAYPQNNIIGFMTPQNITLGISGGASQLELMAIFYAGGILKTAKQSSVAGTFISNHADMSSQVPEIYQIKILKEDLPPGMIDMPPVVAVYAWQEVFE